MEEKKKRGRPPKVKDLSTVRAPGKRDHPAEYTKTFPQVKKGQEPEAGENAAIAMWTMELINISKNADRSNPETLKQCFIDYLNACIKFDHKISNLGAYMAMGISKMTASNWLSGKRNAKDSSYRELIEYVDLICSQAREELIMHGKLNPIIGIFWQKVYDGYRDNADASVSSNALEVSSTAQEIADRYKDIPD